MTVKSSFLFALKLIFPKTAKKTVARKSVFGAIICIALSVIPLVVVLTVSDGMVHGMTERIIELSTSHLKVFVKRNANVTKSLYDFNNFAFVHKNFLLYNLSDTKSPSNSYIDVTFNSKSKLLL